MNSINLKFDIRPKAKQSFRIGKHNYQSKDVIAYQNAIKLMAKSQLKQFDPFTEAISVYVVFAYKIPANKKNVKFKSSKPDIDNLLKGLFDGLNKIAWVDDSQIVEVHAMKIYDTNDYIDINIYDAT